MATKTLFWKDAVPSGATLHRSLQDGGAAPTTATTTTGWVADSNVLGQACLQNGGTEVARTAGTWGTTLQPSAAPSQTVGDAWRSELPFDGTFANANWTLTFGVRSVTAAYAGRFKLAVRVWRSSDPNGANAVELTSGRLASAATAASLTTSADTTVAITWSPGSTVTLRGEYLFVNVGVEVTSAGSGTTQDIDFRVGSAYTIATSDFTPTPASTGDDTTWFLPAMSAVPLLALGLAFTAPNVAIQAAAPAPFVNALVAQVDARPLRVLAEGSRNSRALYDAVTSVPRASLVVARREAPPVQALGADTSAGTPKPLTLDAEKPPGHAAVRSAPDIVRSRLGTREASSSRALYDPVASTDATRGPAFVTRREMPPVLALGDPALAQSRALRDAIVAAPIVNAPGVATPRRPALVTSTTASTPLGLLAGLPPGRRADLGIADWRSVTDTSAKTPKTLTLEPVPPGARAPDAAPERARVSGDTGFVTPLALRAPAVAPVANPQVFAPDRLRPGVDTSRGSAKPLLADAQAPVGENAPVVRSERPPAVVDSSTGSPRPLLDVVALPVGLNAQIFAPDRVRPVFDSSRSSAKPLIADAQLPVGASDVQTCPPDALRPVVDTTCGSTAILPLPQPLPVGVALNLWRIDYPHTVVDTAKGTPKPLYEDAVVVVVPPTVDGGVLRGQFKPAIERPPILLHRQVESRICVRVHADARLALAHGRNGVARVVVAAQAIVSAGRDVRSSVSAVAMASSRIAMAAAQRSAVRTRATPGANVVAVRGIHGKTVFLCRASSKSVALRALRSVAAITCQARSQQGVTRVFVARSAVRASARAAVACSTRLGRAQAMDEMDIALITRLTA